MFMSKDKIDLKIIKIINSLINTKLTINKKFHKNKITEWDSLKNLEIIFKLEEEFKVNFDENELDKLNTLENISKILKDKSEK